MDKSGHPVDNLWTMPRVTGGDSAGGYTARGSGADNGGTPPRALCPPNIAPDLGRQPHAPRAASGCSTRQNKRRIKASGI